MVRKRSNNILEPWGFLPIDRKGFQACFECGEISTGRHHVVPVCKGGTKVIPLCLSCHAKVHEGLNMGLAEMIKQGIVESRAKGRAHGAPRKVTGDVAASLDALRAQGLAYRRIAQSVGLSLGTVWNYFNNPRA